MSQNYSNFDGVVNNVFSIGVGAQALKIEVSRNTAKINKDLDMGEHALLTSMEPTADNQVVPLKYLNKTLDKLASDISAKQMPDGIRIDFSQYTEYPIIVPICLLGFSKFIDRIVLGAIEDLTGSNLEISIGTMDSHEKYLKKTALSTITGTSITEVSQLITDEETGIFMFVNSKNASPEPEGFVQKVYNAHSDVTAKVSTDETKKVITVQLSGAGVQPLITYPEMFGNVSGNYVDFGVNMNLSAGTYRIVQQNACLSLFPDDPSISQDEHGVWTKSKEYTIDDTSEDEFIYTFMMGNRTDNAATHITVYDSDNNVVLTFHIQNSIVYSNELAELLTATEGEIRGNVDVTISDTIEDGIHNVVVSSEAATPDAEELEAGRKITKIHIPYAPTGDFIFSEINPNLSEIEPDEDGIRQISSEIAMPNESELDEFGQVYFAVPLGENKDHAITVTFIDKETNATVVYVIDNQVTFMENTAGSDTPVVDPDEPETPTVTESGALLVRVIAY